MKKLLCALLCAVLVLSGCATVKDAESTGTSIKDFEKQTISFEIHNQQDLDEIYQIEPFNELLPRKIPEGFQVVGGEGVLKVGYFPVRESTLNLGVKYKNADGISINVRVKDYIVRGYPGTVIADPDNPETYDTKWYVEEWQKTTQRTPENMYPKGYSPSGTFYAPRITPEHIKARTYNNEISIEAWCDNFVVSYRCSDYEAKDGAELVSAEELYEMIASAPYVKALKP